MKYIRTKEQQKRLITLRELELSKLVVLEKE